MPSITFKAVYEQETQRLGEILAECLPDACVIGLIGTLGAGKTRLVQAVASAVGVPAGNVTSPTFVLVNEYQGQQPIYHFDTYRLRDEDELMELGPEEYFESPGYTFVEWADRFESLLPPERLTIRITVEGETQRSFEISTDSPKLESVIEQLAKRLK